MLQLLVKGSDGSAFAEDVAELFLNIPHPGTAMTTTVKIMIKVTINHLCTWVPSFAFTAVSAF